MYTRWAALTVPILSLQYRTVRILFFTTTSTTPFCAASVLTVLCAVMSASRLFLNPWCAAWVQNLALSKSLAFTCNRSNLQSAVARPRSPQLHNRLSKAIKRFTVLSVPKKI